MFAYKLRVKENITDKLNIAEILHFPLNPLPDATGLGVYLSATSNLQSQRLPIAAAWQLAPSRSPLRLEAVFKVSVKIKVQ